MRDISKLNKISNIRGKGGRINFCYFVVESERIYCLECQKKTKNQMRILCDDMLRCVSVFMGSDGTNRIVSGSCDKTLKVWNAESGVCERTLQGHTNWVRCVSVFMGSDGTNRIVSGSYDDTLKVWNPESGVCEQTLQGHTNSVTCVSMFMGSDSPHSRIVSGSDDNTLKVWDGDVYDARHMIKVLKRKAEEL